MRFGRLVAELAGGGVAILATLACGDDSSPAITDPDASATEVMGSTSSPAQTTSATDEPTPTTSDAPTDGGPDSSVGQMTTGETSTTADTLEPTSTTDTVPACPAGELACDGDGALQCDDEGNIIETIQCPAVCVPTLGCVLCVPGTDVCDGQVSKHCRPDGLGYDDRLCDPLQGLVCAPDTGRCEGACATDELDASYIGCDYYPTVTPNIVESTFNFAVAVSNTTDAPAEVTITRDDVVIDSFDVGPGDVEVAPLPWIAALKDPSSSAIVQSGAYRLRSTRPVSVYQYSPIEYEKDGEFSHSNDASLLLPTNVWGTETRVIARNTFSALPGAYAVVARVDGTMVEVTPSQTGKPVLPGGGVAADGHGTALLNAGDVLLVISGVAGGTPDQADLTGTLVSASAPVQVIGAHACTNVPYNKQACDHLEESNLPLQNLATGYWSTAPLVKAPKQAPVRKARMVRIVATAAATSISYDPPQPGAPTMLAKPGDYAEFTTDKDFWISASSRIAVAEYMLGQAAGGDTGDPAMTIAVPPELFRSVYAIHAPTNYESNFVNLVAPTGAPVKLDGKPVVPGSWSSIGQTGWSVARLMLEHTDDGDHLLSCTKPFGVQVYGYGQYTSYWYPGGLDLAPL
ncbi:IgGFc-binding protein [Nannocystis radixulma]|uniref:IgGFc-binding protein N-terminal domain-containing protein n=1 Tax=Nannocystis radixulma TaxID=2995305 RepID=A0ABT5BN14_9BACT|nr:hypothetical protein [Nannocystis radixulma]MDC0675559.1 hypothetical protein [Nannocystis radixulma]